MVKFIFRFSLLAMLAAGACSGPGEPTAIQRSSSDQKSFTAEDKRIAKALSIGGSEVKSAGTEIDQAILCSIALQSISGQLRESGALSSEQQQAFLRAQAIYSRRAAAGGRSRSELAAARRDIETAHSEASERARLAMGCLRNLTGT